MRGWLIWALVALCAWGVWAVLSKLLGGALSAEQSQALSTLGFLPIVIPLAVGGARRLRKLSGRGLLLALAGGVVSCLGNIPYYAAVGRGEKFATVLSLVALAPLVTVLLAVLLLRERLGGFQTAGLMLAGIAIWLFNVPADAAVFSRAVGVAVVPIALWGLSGFLQKVATQYIPADAAALVYLGAFLPMGVYYGLSQSWVGEIGVRTWILVVALGFFLAFGNLAVLAAYANHGKASVIAPLVNLFPVVSIGVALVLGERISGREWAGIGVALLSVVGLSWEPQRRGSTAAPGGGESYEKHL